MKNKKYRKTMKAKTREAVDNLEKAFRQKYHWDEDKNGEEINNNNQ